MPASHSRILCCCVAVVLLSGCGSAEDPRIGRLRAETIAAHRAFRGVDKVFDDFRGVMTESAEDELIVRMREFVEAETLLTEEIRALDGDPALARLASQCGCHVELYRGYRECVTECTGVAADLANGESDAGASNGDPTVKVCVQVCEDRLKDGFSDCGRIDWNVK